MGYEILFSILLGGFLFKYCYIYVFIFLNFFIFLVSTVLGSTIEQPNYSSVPDEVPHLPLPKYNTDGSIAWFPRIVGGAPVPLGDFPGKVYVISGV